MKIGALSPQPVKKESFKRNRENFVPAVPGCYALTNFSKDVLYIGLTINLRRRFNDHLDNPKKTAETINGRAIFFFWLEAPDPHINKIERTWLGTHIEQEKTMPILNKVFSPTST